MTLRTVLAKRPAMYVLRLVAGITCNRKAGRNHILFLVTAMAAKLFVRPCQREFGTRIMVETDLPPA